MAGRERKIRAMCLVHQRVEKTRDTAKDTQREKATLPNAFLYNNIAYSIRTCDDDIRKCEHLYLLSLFFIHIIILGDLGFWEVE